MSDINVLIEAFTDALHGRPIKDLGVVNAAAKMADPQNKVVLARCALIHAGLERGSILDDRLLRTSTEDGSPLYDSMTYSALSTIRTPEAKAAWTSFLAVHALCRPGPVEWIQFNYDGEKRRVDPHTGYRYPSVMAANRALWDEGKVSYHWDRSILGPAVAWDDNGDADYRPHPDYEWMWEAITVHCPWNTLLPEDTAGLVEMISMPSRVRVDIMHFANNDIIVIRERSTHNTRGSALVTHYDASQKTLNIYSAAKPRGAGEWTACIAIEHGFDWSTSQRNGAHQLTGKYPDSPVRHHVIWDAAGARLVGEALPPPVYRPTKDERIMVHLARIDAETYEVDPPRGANHRPLQTIRNRTNAIRRIL